ncbi:hypothetical protein [Lentibacter algarum]|uniref:hypothetical protein n=1 Tax=Lentibacter algarum TaxID=576131 RepID=UPI0026ED4D47|nr:hypothetical protein [Lentibacter algarum]
MTYLTDSQILEMADASLTAYEVTGEKRRMGEVAAEYAADEFGVKATSAQIGYAVKLALTGWEGIKAATRKAVDAQFAS